jgi:hypothetical protein
VVGDFNEILCNKEKSGGPKRQVGPMLRFRKALKDCSLEDLGYFGSVFTWSNKFTKERLDRGLCSAAWRGVFPHSRVLTLPPSQSDHCPILVEGSFEPFHYTRIPRLFHFEEMWTTHADCAQVIQRGWSHSLTEDPSKQVILKIQSTSKALGDWHKGVFQHRLTEINIIRDKLDTIMRLPFDAGHFDYQKVLNNQLQTLLSQNEIYWRQRSRVSWLKDGDRNTAFFHKKACNWRARNQISSLSDEQGVSQTDPESVQKIILNYFEKIFCFENCDLEALDVILAILDERVTAEMRISVDLLLMMRLRLLCFKCIRLSVQGLMGCLVVCFKNIGAQ